MFTLIIFLIILSILVVVHEFGHFITARKSGMKVYEFGIGFPPRAIGIYKDPKTKKFVWVIRNNKKKQKEEENNEEFPATVYSLNWLPLGGFVRIKGENGEQRAEKDSFMHQKIWKRLVVLVAGVFMNFVLAAVLLSFGFIKGLPADPESLKDSHAIVVQEPSVMIQQVEKDSPADKSGMQFGDKVLFINGKKVNTSNEMMNFIKENGSKELSLKVEKSDKTIKEVFLIPQQLKEGEQPRIGVFLADAGIVRFPWYIALYKGFVAASYGLINIFIAFFLLLKNLIMGKGLAFDVSGPVGIAVVVGQSAKLGFAYLINVTAMISLSLAAINILPIPALDGGRALFVVLEKILRRPVSMKYEQLAHTIGFVLLMLLVVIVTFRDVVGLF